MSWYHQRCFGPVSVHSSSLSALRQDHWLPGFNFNVEEWHAKGRNYETLAICRSLDLARAAFAAAIAEKPVGRFMIRNRTRVVQRHPEGEWRADIGNYSR